MIGTDVTGIGGLARKNVQTPMMMADPRLFTAVFQSVGVSVSQPSTMGIAAATAANSRQCRYFFVWSLITLVKMCRIDDAPQYDNQRAQTKYPEAHGKTSVTM